MVNVLITRPAPMAEQLTRIVADLGLEPVPMPMLGIEAIADNQGTRDRLLDLLPVDWMIFSSVNAVEHTLQLLAPERLGDSRVAAVGRGTARKLQQAGIGPVLIPREGYDSRALMAMPEFAHGDGKKAVVLSAPGGREVIYNSLQQNGWEVAKVDVYRRLALAPSQQALLSIRNADRLIAVFTAGSAMKFCKQMLDQSSWSKILQAEWVVISARLKGTARVLGAHKVHIAQGPDNQSIAEAVARVAGMDV